MTATFEKALDSVSLELGWLLKNARGSTEMPDALRDYVVALLGDLVAAAAARELSGTHSRLRSQATPVGEISQVVMRLASASGATAAGYAAVTYALELNGQVTHGGDEQRTSTVAIESAIADFAEKVKTTMLPRQGGSSTVAQVRAGVVAAAPVIGAIAAASLATTNQELRAAVVSDLLVAAVSRGLHQVLALAARALRFPDLPGM